jgi:hypothetical protein
MALYGMQQPQPIPDIPAAKQTQIDVPERSAWSLDPRIALFLWAVAACLLTLINRFAGHFVPIPLFGTLAAQLVAIPYLLLLLLTLLKMGRAAARLPFSAPFLLIAGVLLAAPVGVTLLLQNMKIFPPTWLFLTANNLFLPLAAALVGAGVGRVIKHPNTLLAAAGFSIFFDIVVVTMGTVAVLMKSNSNIIAAVSVGAGSLPTTAGPAAVALKQYDPISAVTIGPADVLFVALFLSAIYQLKLSRRTTFIWMFILLGIALLVVQITSLPIPALAPMGIAVLIANLSHAAFTAQEKRDLKIGAAFAVFCATLIVFGARTFLAPPPAPPRLGFAMGRLQGPQGQLGPLVITGINKESPAAKAGLKPGDTILAINGSPATDDQLEASKAELLKRKGMTLTIQRPGEPKSRLIQIDLPKET